MVIRSWRDARLDVLDVAPNAVIQFKQRPKVGIGRFQRVNGIAVAGELFSEGVVEMFWLHDRTKALPLRPWLP